jgi:hypothetical protein
MSKILSSKPRLGAVLQFETRPEYGYSRSTVTVNEAAPLDYVVGTVLGKVTATGKYKRLEATAADGSQNFAGIYIGSPAGEDYQTVAATTDTPVVIIFRDAGVGKATLVFGASVDTQGEKDAVYAQMVAAGIQLFDQV